MKSAAEAHFGTVRTLGTAWAETRTLAYRASARDIVDVAAFLVGVNRSAYGKVIGDGHVDGAVDVVVHLTVFHPRRAGFDVAGKFGGIRLVSN